MSIFNLVLVICALLGCCVACYILGRIDEEVHMRRRVEDAQKEAEKYKTLYELRKDQTP